MADTSRRQSQISLKDLNIDDDELGSFSNVDEIFTKLNISQIQQLTKKYKSVIDSTKSDLHNLVGSKYRDLIKIAEDINDIYQTSNDIDSRIQQLSYKPTKFISIYLDNYGKFDSYNRKQNALVTKKKTRSIIVRNVINKKLNKLDQKIKQGNSPLIHTSNFIYYAKVYYTIETLFKDIIQNDESIRLYFYQLKKNLNDYLEKELSCYNLSESIVHTNDKFKSRQRLNIRDLVMNNSQILLQDDFDIDYDDIVMDDEDDDEADDGNDDNEVAADNAFEVDEMVNSKLESYDRNTLVIINYLVSYTILNGGKLLIASSFIELRTKYIVQLLDDIKQKALLDQVNFYQIFKFLEHTCEYVDNYFQKASSDYHRILSHVTKPWNATNLIGHKVWIEDELIKFDIVSTSDSFNRDSKFTDLAKLVFDFTINCLPQDDNKFENLTLTVFIFHNFLVCLKRLQDAAQMAGKDCKLISVISETGFLNELLSKVSSFINSSYIKHVSHLTSERDQAGNGAESLSSLIEKTLKSDLNQNLSYQLFTPDLVNLMDVNTEKYIQILSGEKPIHDSIDAITEITEWFRDCEKFNKIVTIEAKDSRNSKMDAFKCIPHLHSYLQNINWGEFTIKVLDNEFLKLSSTMTELFWEQIYKLLDFISKLSKTVTSSDKVVYIIGIINQLKDRITSTQSQPSSVSANESIDKLNDELFTRLINDMPTNNFYTKFEESIIDCVSIDTTGNDNDQLFIRPNLKITTSLYQLAEEYLRIIEISNKNLQMFLNFKSRDNFIKIKNDWFKKNLVSERFVPNVEKHIRALKDEKKQEEVKEEQLEEVEGAKENEEIKEEIEEKEEEQREDEDQEQDKEEQPEESTSNGKDINSDSSFESVINGSSILSKTQALAILANYTFLLHFYLSKVEVEDIDDIIQLIKQYYKGDIEKSTMTMVVDSVASFYRSHKNIYLPLLVLE